ncbi:hypothetical protein ON010_g4623 [Phytophthora cinnamomi]|nr:hypothetical protein ON010_g4623 [Phytophthora cinnamomi]
MLAQGVERFMIVRKFIINGRVQSKVPWYCRADTIFSGPTRYALVRTVLVVAPTGANSTAALSSAEWSFAAGVAEAGQMLWFTAVVGRPSRSGAPTGAISRASKLVFFEESYLGLAMALGGFVLDEQGEEDLLREALQTVRDQGFRMQRAADAGDQPAVLKHAARGAARAAHESAVPQELLPALHAGAGRAAPLRELRGGAAAGRRLHARALRARPEQRQRAAETVLAGDGGLRVHQVQRGPRSRRAHGPRGDDQGRAVPAARAVLEALLVAQCAGQAARHGLHLRAGGRGHRQRRHRLLAAELTGDQPTLDPTAAPENWRLETVGCAGKRKDGAAAARRDESRAAQSDGRSHAQCLHGKGSASAAG